MSGLERVDIVRLTSEVASFSTSSHVRYLSEALQTTRESGNPGEALKLLRAMWGTAYARSAEEKRSLQDVGGWLERRLHRDPAVDASRMAVEMAWARRIARIAEANLTEQNRNEGSADRRGDRHPRNGPPDRSGGGPPFGRLVDSILRRRREVFAGRDAERDATRGPSPHAGKAHLAPVPAHAPVLTELPPIFEAELVQFPEAREAYRDARDREKRNKAPKERFLVICPVDARLRPLTAGLVCSTLLPGFTALFQAVAAQGGAPRTFYVRGVEERGGRQVVREILLTAP